ncbi:glycosyltransferase family 92 protein [Nisaea acidiphila]|uniref:Glycosyltransferase family 92 protein n=1 Tax=Nisaea acidiphila TaxID=1862145 RepID=A0A9J7AR24_9PROT|nr:glycosyltransferase family 92 protein [Nisaea acidiphila]UUX49033.1 glycosyltransferase family 92 protein [Nisaea acidiphila]
MHYLAICAIFRDEARYLAEWLTHYELQGVEHFYLYDDQSSDTPEEVLRPWLDRGVVTLHKVDATEQRQRWAYTHCINTHRNEAFWVGFFDIDEFAFVRNRPESLAEMMPRYEGFPGLGINWVCYGSSGFETPPGPLVTTSYQLRGMMGFRTGEPSFLKDGRAGTCADDFYPYNAHIKSIIRLDAVERMISPHSFLYRNDALAVSPSGRPIVDTTLRAFSRTVETATLRINHYWSKSKREFRTKIGRRRADIKEYYGEHIAFLREAGMNLEYDPSILPDACNIAEKIGVQFSPGTEAEWREREAFQKSRDLNAEAQVHFEELKAADRSSTR